MNWRVFSILFLAVFASMLGAGLVVPLLPAYAHSLGASGLYIGLIFAGFSISRSFFLPLFGKWSDTAGRKPFLTFGLLAYFVTSIAYMLARDVNGLILVRFFQGIAAAMILPVAQAYAGEITPKSKEGLIMGLFNAALSAGLSAGPIVGGAVTDAFGIQAAFGCMGFVCFSAFLLCGAFLPSRKFERISSVNSAPASYRRLLSNRYIAGLFLFRLIYTMCVGSIWTFAPLLANTEFRFSGFATGALITLNMLLSAVLMTPVGFLADKISKRALIALGGLITAIALLFFHRGQQPWLLFAGSALIGLGGGIALPPISAMAVVAGRKEHSMGSMMGLLTMGHSLAMVFGPLAGGIIADLLNLRLVFGYGAIIMVIGTALVLTLTTGYAKFERD